VWDSSGYKADNTGESFVFSLKNPRTTEPKIFPLLQAQYAVYCHSSYGSIFGVGHAICVGNNCNQDTSSYTNLGSGYANDTGIDGTQVFTGERNFQVKEIEVFAVSS
jgi:hypothetical protein